MTVFVLCYFSWMSDLFIWYIYLSSVSALKALLRVHFIQAQELLGKDKFLGGLIKGKSDPYGILQLGTQEFKSKVIKGTLDPKWNEVYEVSGCHSYTVSCILVRGSAFTCAINVNIFVGSTYRWFLRFIGRFTCT